MGVDGGSSPLPSPLLWCEDLILKHAWSQDHRTALALLTQGEVKVLKIVRASGRNG